jgi:hypothetical protein
MELPRCWLPPLRWTRKARVATAPVSCAAKAATAAAQQRWSLRPPCHWKHCWEAAPCMRRCKPVQQQPRSHLKLRLPVTAACLRRLPTACCVLRRQRTKALLGRANKPLRCTLRWSWASWPVWRLQIWRAPRDGSVSLNGCCQSLAAPLVHARPLIIQQL